jgi:hypothetical protein
LWQGEFLASPNPYYLEQVVDAWELVHCSHLPSKNDDKHQGHEKMTLCSLLEILKLLVRIFPFQGFVSASFLSPDLLLGEHLEALVEAPQCHSVDLQVPDPGCHQHHQWVM